jgi:hypothetical protein
MRTTSAHTHRGSHALIGRKLCVQTHVTCLQRRARSVRVRVIAASRESEMAEVAEAPPSPNGTEGSKSQPRKLRRKPIVKESSEPLESPLIMVTKPLPRVLMLHTGGTLGMDPAASYEAGEKGVSLRRGTGGVYAGHRPLFTVS